VGALQSVTTQVDDPESRQVLVDLLEAVRGGAPLARAVEAHPETFPNLYASMVRAGEESGTLPLSLSRLADTSRSRPDPEPGSAPRSLIRS